MRYLPHTAQEIESMLGSIGVDSVDALFAGIPATHRLQRPLAIEPSLDEAALMRHLEDLAKTNAAAEALCFLGGGSYDHHIPPAVDQLLLRSEFYTAYTPYQAEVSQGTLQSIFEFQTLVAELTGLDVANASMYDGASAAAEAVLMARRVTGKSRVLLSVALHPEYIETVRTYLRSLNEGREDALEFIPALANGQVDLEALRASLGKDAAAVVIGYPNFWGCVEDLRAVQEVLAGSGALLISATSQPHALALLEAPGRLGADIAVAEGQALAVPPQFGGPGVGLLACRETHLRNLPGRLVGETVDAAGRRGYVLTLSTREQHIRRERATSNICTNHGLIALAFTMHAAMLGRHGLREKAMLCFSGAEYLKGRLKQLSTLRIPYSAPTFNEFVVELSQGKASEAIAKLSQQGLLVGPALSRFAEGGDKRFLIAVTEKHRREDIDRLVDALAAL